LSKSLEYVSINAALHLINLAPENLVNIKMHIQDWSQNIENSKKLALISNDYLIPSGDDYA